MFKRIFTIINNIMSTHKSTIGNSYRGESAGKRAEFSFSMPNTILNVRLRFNKTNTIQYEKHG